MFFVCVQYSMPARNNLCFLFVVFHLHRLNLLFVVILDDVKVTSPKVLDALAL